MIQNVRVFLAISPYQRLFRSPIALSFRLAKTFEHLFQNFENRTLMLIQHLIAKYPMQSWEINYFDKLGEEIMVELINEVYPTDPEKIKTLGHDTPEKRSKRLEKVKNNMRARKSPAAFGDYPWNSVSLALRDQYHHWHPIPESDFLILRTDILSRVFPSRSFVSKRVG